MFYYVLKIKIQIWKRDKKTFKYILLKNIFTKKMYFVMAKYVTINKTNEEIQNDNNIKNKCK